MKDAIAAADNPRQVTTDTFQNFAAKVGIGTDNLSSGNTYGFAPITRIRLLLEWMYRGSWICGNAVDCVADDMTREGIDFGPGLKPELAEKIQNKIRDMQVWQSLNQVAKWARLYGGACGYLMIDGQNPATPLRLDTIGKGQFKGIVSMDRWMFNPNVMESVMQPGPDFGTPLTYQTVAQSPQFPFPVVNVHHTRLVRMLGIELPYWQAVTEMMWGMSIYERIYDRLTAFDSTTQGAAQLAYKCYLRTLKVKDLRSIIAVGGKAFEALVAQVELMRRYQSNEGITLLDGNDEMEAHNYTFAGLADMLDKMADQIAGATQIPIARLFGQSPGGMNSTGDHELRTYYDNITRQQERWFRRPMDVIITLIAANEGISLPEGWSYRFKSLWQMTDEEKANIDRNDTDSVMTVSDGGLISPKLALQELRARGRITGRWTSITDKDINQAEDEVPDPSELLMGSDNVNPAKDKPVGVSKGGKGPANDQLSIMDVQGLPIYLENHKDTWRTGGKGVTRWQTKMPAHYGYIEGIGSAEGAFEQLDCYVGDNLDARQVFIIDQVHPDTKAFDEHKCMIGFASQDDAELTYARAFSDGRGMDRLGAITPMSMEMFKQWMKMADLKQPANSALRKVAAE